jgi:hypothetical protein
MKRCPNCGYIVPAAWTECRQCATPLALGDGSRASTVPERQRVPPAPTRVPITVPPAPLDALLPASARINGHAVDRPAPVRPAGPDTWLPRVDPALLAAEAAPAKPHISKQAVVVGVVVLVCLVAGAYSVTHRGHHEPSVPTILAPREPFAGIPTNLADVVRIEAESTRHTALSVIISAAASNPAPLSSAQLAGLQPGYHWLAGNQASTTNTEISVSSGPGIDMIAVSGTNKDICAYGRWSTAAGPSYVTMAHVTSCTAASAPADGWSTIAGGAAQDLPNELGS